VPSYLTLVCSDHEGITAYLISLNQALTKLARKSKDKCISFRVSERRRDIIEYWRVRKRVENDIGLDFIILLNRQIEEVDVQIC